MHLLTRRDAIKGLPALACAVALPSWAVEGQAPIPGAAFDDAQLRAAFSGELIGRGSAAYDAARRTDNLAFDRHPLLVARCAGTDDAARALEFARRRGIPVAVRGGGHCQAGRSSCDDGVVIDLARLNEVSVDPARGTVSCGAGARIWQASEAAAQHGLALPLGTCGDVGVSGLTLGGGVGYLMGVAGAACDALLAADIVLADGRRLTVSEASDPDLMWALRGAGANFGIVTRLVFRAVRLEKVLAGMLTFPPPAAHDVLALANSLSTMLPDELSVFSQVIVLPDGGRRVEMGVCWAGNPAHGRAEIARLITAAVSPLEQPLRETTLAQFVGRGDSGSGPSCARFGVAQRSLPDSALAVLLERSDLPAFRLVFLDPLHGAITRQPAGPTSFPRVPMGAGVGFILGWEDAGQTRAVREWADRAWGELAPGMSQAYVNMLDDEGEARVREAYGGNYRRLQRLKSRYDPDNVFRSNQNIVPFAA
ncbi:MAG: FAD-binding oxidoreductase [Gammaproteobacteria bacterium]|nr:FAD-binding oxidoreductase [Gammaproteobacteria bacterium]